MVTFLYTKVNLIINPTPFFHAHWIDQSPYSFIDTSILGNIGIVLMQPKFPENIGAAARSAFNMGISRIIVVRDEVPDHDAMAKMATHKAVQPVPRP